MVSLQEGVSLSQIGMYVFVFILLVWDICEQANTKKIQQNLQLIVAKIKV